MNRTLGVLISGRGSNLKAIIDAIQRGELDARIAVVISNRTEAPGLDHAIAAGIETLVLNHKAYASREDYDRALVVELKTRGVSLVCLAGFMRMLSPVFVEAFPNRILNIHPSLLPKYPGLHPQQQALDDHAAESGATVHIVNKDLDAGPIVLQRSVPVMPGDIAVSDPEGISFIPPHLAAKVADETEMTHLVDEWGHSMLRSGKYTPGQIDGQWSPAMIDEFNAWLASKGSKVRMPKK